MIEEESYLRVSGASAPGFLVSQAGGWLCGRIFPRFILPYTTQWLLYVAAAGSLGQSVVSKMRRMGVRRAAGYVSPPLARNEGITTFVHDEDMCSVVFVYAYCCFNQSVKTAPGFLAPPSPMISAAFSMSFCGLNRWQAIL